MRGKGCRCTHASMRFRITPAYAGKRTERRIRTAEKWDHPRLCGEKSATAFPWRKVQGSPPPMRGKGFPKFRRRLFIGITPAYAGKRYIANAVASERVALPRDHPRLCGEK